MITDTTSSPEVEALLQELLIHELRGHGPWCTSIRRRVETILFGGPFGNEQRIAEMLR